MGIGTSLLYKGKEKVEAQRDINAVSEDERTELMRLRAEIKTLRMEKEIFKKSEHVLRKRNEVPVWATLVLVGTTLLLRAFFESLKHDWIFKQHKPTREHIKTDVAAFMKYYNLEHLHTANNYMSSINYENSLKRVSG